MNKAQQDFIERLRQTEGLSAEHLAKIEKLQKREEVKQKRSGLPDYQDPALMYEFLYRYNQDPVLKTTCHLVDSNMLLGLCKIWGIDRYDFGHHHKDIVTAYNRLSNSFNAQKRLKNINGLIFNYLTSKKPKWSSGNISEGWGTVALASWAKKKNNIGMPPNPDEALEEQRENDGYKFTKALTIRSKRLEGLANLCLHFKNLFHITSANSLSNALKRVDAQKHLPNGSPPVNFDPDQFHTDIELFTDVDKVVQTYEEILKIVADVSKGSGRPARVSVSCEEDSANRQVHLCIHHLESTFSKRAQSLADRLGTRYKSLINNQINGLCNFYQIARFSDGKDAEVNVWNGEERRVTPLATSLASPSVTYKLVFKKPKINLQ